MNPVFSSIRYNVHDKPNLWESSSSCLKLTKAFAAFFKLVYWFKKKKKKSVLTQTYGAFELSCCPLSCCTSSLFRLLCAHYSVVSEQCWVCQTKDLLAILL